MSLGVFDAIDLDLTKFPVELPAPIQALIWQYSNLLILTNHDFYGMLVFFYVEVRVDAKW